MRLKARGITLIELLVAVAIVAILAAVAVPGYNRYSLRSYRTQAFTDLGICALAAERQHSDTYTFANIAPAGAGAPTVCTPYSPNDATAPSARRYIFLVLPVADASTFTLRANPANGQVGNGFLELTSAGIKRWDKNNNGAMGAPSAWRRRNGLASGRQSHRPPLKSWRRNACRQWLSAHRSAPQIHWH